MIGRVGLDRATSDPSVLVVESMTKRSTEYQFCCCGVARGDGERVNASMGRSRTATSAAAVESRGVVLLGPYIRQLLLKLLMSQTIEIVDVAKLNGDSQTK